MKPIIKVENLGKQYRIGTARAPYSTLRESLTHALRAPLGLLNRKNNSTDDTFWALKDVSFEVMPGEVVGVIGRNGAGKSTLLKLLSRITEPTTGKIDLYGRVGSLLEVGTGFHAELTGRENIYLNGAILGMKRAEIARKLDEIIAFAEIEKFIDMPVKHYSSGMHMRLAFAVAAHLEPEILIVDEVLAVGDAEFQKKCLTKMNDIAEQGRTIIFVSHNISAIADLCTRGIFLQQGHSVSTKSLSQSIELYLGESQLHEAWFSNDVLTYASVKQVEDYIEIRAVFNAPVPLTMPCLGFVIRDRLGRAISGSNPVVDGVKPFDKSCTNGEIKVKITQPKLLNGTYCLSLWFGNGEVDWIHLEDCLSFETLNMAKTKQYIKPAGGPVFAECKWSLNAK